MEQREEISIVKLLWQVVRFNPSTQILHTVIIHCHWGLRHHVFLNYHIVWILIPFLWCIPVKKCCLKFTNMLNPSQNERNMPLSGSYFGSWMVIDYINTILLSICAPVHKTHSSYNTEVTPARNIQIRQTSFPPIFYCQNNCLAAHCWQQKLGSDPSGARRAAHSLGIELMRPADGPAVVTLVWVTNIKPWAVWILHVVK